MNYCYVEKNAVINVIPEFNPAFPDIPVNKRFSADFVAHLVPDETETARQGYIYDSETETFSAPPEPEPEEYIPDPDESDDTSDESALTLDDLTLAVAELAEKQESDKLELELAIAELAELTV